ncbi:MAG: hypothetical protein HYR51_18095 [Candidatus Rokubacteria bacterium]|nr:hypothetical protein [Candidatus Rokubacteria bacterium]
MMLRPGWVLETYLGWSVRLSQPGLKLLLRPYGPLLKWLVLAHGVGDSDLEDALSAHGVGSTRSLIVLNDFRACNALPRVLVGRRLEPVHQDRWFGVGTFVVDLTQPAETLWRGISDRRRARTVTRAGVTVSFTRRPPPGVLEEFFRLHATMAGERGIRPLARPAVARMFADERVLLADCRDADGRALVMNIIYLGTDEAFFLYGARATEIPPGAGRLAHWETMLELQRGGYLRYDLGQVASCDPSDGIYRFKRSFGGTFVSFGTEYQWRSAAWRIAYALRRSA